MNLISPTLATRSRPTVNEIQRLLKYLRPYWRRFTFAIFATLIGAGLGLVFPWVMQDLVNSVISRGKANQLNQIAILLSVTFIIRAIFNYLQGYTLAYIGERIVTDMRSQVYAHLQQMGLRYFSDRRVGELISRISSDVTLVRSALTNNLASVFSQSIIFAGSLFLMGGLNWRLTFLILGIAPALVITAIFLGRRLRKLSTEVQDQLASSTALAEETLSGIRVVKAFTRETYETERYHTQIERTFRVTIRLTLLRSAFGPFVSLLAFFALTGVMWFGGKEVLAGRLTGGALVAFLVYGLNVVGALNAFAGLYSQLQEAAGASRRLFEILDEPPDIADCPGAVILPPVKGYLTFENLSFAYGNNHTVLHDINLEIQPGEVMALVGPSGAGKSTLFNLIPRFYDPTSGKVCIDGQDLTRVTVLSLRSQIGLVPQESILFSGSIRDNLRYGKLGATDSEIEEAARSANAEEFILRFPERYDTMVGERGANLSGGQRQRIAVARAILKDPRILLLDEATSSLDSESEGLVQEALERLMRGRTTVIIAHRLSTIHKANRIAVLDLGRLVELGTHAELMAADGLYARLYRLQFRKDAESTLV